MTSPGRFLRSSDGFVLAATIWVLAAMLLAVGVFALWANRAVEMARDGQADLQGEIDLQSTKAVALYLLATRYVTVAGLTMPGDGAVTDEDLVKNFSSPLEATIAPIGGELPLDDRAFSGVGSARFSIQDEGGLLAINNYIPVMLERLLGILGVESGQRGGLIDKLADYIDKDDLHRINGAETRAYLEQGLLPPANRPLLTSWETRSVMGWAGHEGFWEKWRLPRSVTVAMVGLPNFNTAPNLVLQTIDGMDVETAHRIIEARKLKPFSAPEDIFKAAGMVLPLDPISLAFLASPSLRLTLWTQGGRRMREVHVLLTPNGLTHTPWLIDYDITVPLTEEQENAEINFLKGAAFASPVYSEGS